MITIRRPKFYIVFSLLSAMMALQTATAGGLSSSASHPPDKKNINKVILLKGANSKFDEFAPLWFDSTLYFCSNKPLDWNMDPPPVTGMVMIKPLNLDPDSLLFTSPEPFARKLQTAIHHGPLCFNPRGDTLYYTRADKKAFQNADTQNKLHIMVAVKDGKSWREIGPFAYNTNDYNTAHPAISTDGKYFYFASDRPGGFGGMDIWRCKMENGKWGKPENLGGVVNSPGDEAFPQFYKGKLYYASNGLPGKGGFDIFVSAYDHGWSSPQNLGKPVNSSKDDLGLTFARGGLGFFSSNRDGGLGGDDLYAWISGDLERNFATLNGRLKYMGEPAAKVDLELKDHLDNYLQRTKSDSVGYFVFHDVDGAENYKVDIVPDSVTGKVKQGYTMELLSKDKKVVKRIAQGADNNFQFELLAPDDYDTLPFKSNDDNSMLNIALKGQVYQNTPGDMGDSLVVYLLTKDRDVLNQTFTSNKGLFSMENVMPMDQYYFRVNQGKNNLKINIINGKGEVLQTLVRGPNNDFKYERLKNDDQYVTMMNEQDVEINVKLDENFKIPNIYFDVDKWDIKPEAAKSLDKLVDLLQRNPKIRIEIDSHTDSRGATDYNLKLSQKRAESTMQYIVGQGISADRLVPVGKGESDPVNGCVDGVPCTEAQYAENRRTEFHVLGLEK